MPLLSDTMIIEFILDLCARKDDMLYKWVTEIFDFNGRYFILTNFNFLILQDCVLITQYNAHVDRNYLHIESFVLIVSS